MKTPPKRIRDADASRARLWQAGADEFAAQGFDGAKVDRIAARAGVNKAMLYYHFNSKAGLYTAVLVETFSAIADSVARVREQGGAPEEQLRSYVATVARTAVAHPYFPQVWLREVADGGGRVDATVGRYVGTVLTMLGAMLQEGVAAGTMRPANPFLLQLSVVGPLTLFLASEPMRRRLAQAHAGPALPIDVAVDEMVEHLQTMVLASLRIERVRKSR